MRTSQRAGGEIGRLVLKVLLVSAIVFACYRLRNIITTLLVAAIIAYTLDPLVEWLRSRNLFVRSHTALIAAFTPRAGGAKAQRARVRLHTLRTIATLYVFVFAVLVVWQGARLVLTPFVEEFRGVTARDPITHKSQLQTVAEEALRKYDSSESIPDVLKSDNLLSQLERSHLGESAQKVVGDASLRILESLKNIVEIVLLPVLAFYFLIDGRKLKHEFLALAPRRHVYEANRMLTEFSRIMRAFVAGQFILCLIAGGVVGAGLAALGVRYPVTMGVLAGITRAIPIIGPIIGGIPIILLTWVSKGVGTALAVLGFFTLLHLLESKFVMPMLIGDRMELHPVVIILVLLVGGEVGSLLISGQLGALLGMFFAAPVASLVRLMIRRYWLRLPLRRGDGSGGRPLETAIPDAVQEAAPAPPQPESAS